MNLRRTNVDWDPRLIRIEYLDDKGQPYYCSFERTDDGTTMEGPTEEVPAAAAPRAFGQEQLS